MKVLARSRRARLVGAVSAAALVLAACGVSDEADSGGGGADESGPYQVLMVFGLTGPVAGNAQAEVNSMKAAADVLNSSGGIAGREVTVKVVDTQTDPTKAVSLLQEQLTGESKPDLVWAGVTSDETLAMLPVLTQRKLLSVAQTAADASNDPAKYPYHFGMQPAASVAAEAAAKRLVADGHHKVGLIAADSAYGQSTAEASEKAFEAAGLDVVRESYSSTAVDLTAPMQRVAGANPDAVYFQGYGAPSTYLLNAREKLGMTDVPFMGSLSVSATNTTETTSATALANTTLQIYKIQQFVDEGSRGEALTTMIDATKKYGKLDQAMNLYSNTYDSLMLVAAATEQAGTADPEKVAEAMESLKVPDEANWVTFSDYGFSADSHFATPPQEGSGYAFVAAKPGPAVDGMIKS